MVEKRPYPGDHGDANGVKRAKPAAPTNVNDVLAAARAKAAAQAAAINARISASKPGSNGASASPTPPPPAAAPAEGLDRLAAMKARVAALRQASDVGPRFATTLGNRRTESPLPPKAQTAPVQEEKAEAQNPYYDPKAAPVGKARVARGLLFNQRGKYLDQASKLRAQGRLEQIKAMLAKQSRQAGLDENSERGFLVQQPPDVEWWDEGILEDKTYDCIDDPSKIKIDGDDSIITLYVQHPVLLKAPQDQRLVEVKPMYLTSKEQAKLRRMRRAEEHKEQQAKIRLGLEPPPPPKVKRGNMMRVMGEQAIADPTAVEMLVESQIQERQDKHEQANEERKLTKEQRHAKLAENQQKDAQKGVYMCAFKINTLAFSKHRYQIDINAKQNALTGMTIMNPTMNLVIVEGGVHSIQKYKKLMLQRIKWTENGKPTEIQEEKQAADPQWMKSVDEKGNLKDLSHNKCTLVFEGEVKQRAFRKWVAKMCETEGEAKELLGRSKMDSMWALAKSSD
ncbi:PRP3-domain-containing protein [Aaosphaeria arxii CBS 175.79]|uniref:PRP3-domain-containing protein n=1 Tax=Aaosphaeria arxii CBS 175.79 TaxID=1450172 RepID=A0A6A5XHR4_9PLEO|nr:PRP3-domain-containing protein [Aaosphaeria arxii CBS 175.79]KAF2011854.1 PRP3-domain-containing protein [Aaosphaeria arxii CBS 175.79]